VVALFTIGINELGQGEAYYETYRWFILAGLGWVGVALFIVGRIKNARLTRRIKAMHDKGQTEINGQPPEKPFFFFSMTYWGIMLLIFGVIILVIAPPESKVAAAESDAPPKLKKAVPAQPPPIEPEELPELKMQGVVFRQPNPSALINGRTYYVGDTIGEVRILAIDSTSVAIEFRGEQRTLTLED
jgi:hypothetical protein